MKKRTKEQYLEKNRNYPDGFLSYADGYCGIPI